MWAPDPERRRRTSRTTSVERRASTRAHNRDADVSAFGNGLQHARVLADEHLLTWSHLEPSTKVPPGDVDRVAGVSCQPVAVGSGPAVKHTETTCQAGTRHQIRSDANAFPDLASLRGRRWRGAINPQGKGTQDQLTQPAVIVNTRSDARTSSSSDLARRRSSSDERLIRQVSEARTRPSIPPMAGSNP